MKNKHKYKYVPFVTTDDYAFYEFCNRKPVLEMTYGGKIKNVEVVRGIFGGIKYFAFDVEKKDDRCS